MRTTTHKSTNNGPVIGNSLPTPVCQQPDKNSPKACAMQQLAGNQRKRALRRPLLDDALNIAMRGANKEDRTAAA